VIAASSADSCYCSTVVTFAIAAAFVNHSDYLSVRILFNL